MSKKVYFNQHTTFSLTTSSRTEATASPPAPLMGETTLRNPAPPPPLGPPPLQSPQPLQHDLSIIRGRRRLRHPSSYLSAYIFVCLTDAELRCLRVSLRGDDDVADVSQAAAAWGAAFAAIRATRGASVALYPPYLSSEQIGAEFPFYAF